MNLSPRETRVAHLVADGKANKEIAAILGISEPTVKVYIKSLFAKLQVRSRAALAVSYVLLNPAPYGLERISPKG